MEIEQVKIDDNLITKVKLQNSSGALAMGIISIVCFCCLYLGFACIILAILAIIYGNKAMIEYKKNPAKYTETSYKNAKAGRICGIIGACLGGLWIIILITYLSIIGWAIGTAFTTMPSW